MKKNDTSTYLCPAELTVGTFDSNVRCCSSCVFVRGGNLHGWCLATFAATVVAVAVAVAVSPAVLWWCWRFIVLFVLFVPFPRFLFGVFGVFLFVAFVGVFASG